MPAYRPFLLACAFLLAAVAMPGCYFERKKPVPQIVVTVTSDLNRYRLDDATLSYDQLQTELKALADKYRSSGTGNARAYVKIITDPGADFDRSLEVVNYCASVGLDKVETTGR